MNKQDLAALTETWQSDTTWLNDKVDEMFKAAQDHAYALGLSRGLALRTLSDDEVLRIAERFGAFEHGDAQGHKRIEFARALHAAMQKVPTFDVPVQGASPPIEAMREVVRISDRSHPAWDKVKAWLQTVGDE